MNTNLRSLATAFTVTGLALGSVGLAQPRAWPSAPARPALGAPGAAIVGLRVPGVAGPHMGAGAAVSNLAAWPIGTTVELRFFDADPADGEKPRSVVGLTVGVDSEVIFADAVAAAMDEAEGWEVAVLVVAVGEARRVVALPGEEVMVRGRHAGGVVTLRLATAGMRVGDGVTVTLFDGDPAQEGAALETLGFAYGVDSAIGFHAALAEAVIGAAYAEVVTSPRSWTIDLKTVQARRGAMRDRLEHLREHMGDLPARFPVLTERMRERLGAADGEHRLPDVRRLMPGRR
jgi:hypothetical protein